MALLQQRSLRGAHAFGSARCAIAGRRPCASRAPAHRRPAPTPAPRRLACAVYATASEAPSPLATATVINLAENAPSSCPNAAGVYAVYSPDGVLQFVGLSRKIAGSVAGHMQAVPELVGSVRCAVVEDATREGLTAVWKEWVEAAIADTGDIPPGNKQGETKWQLRAKPPKSEIKLTAGKPINVPIETLIDQVVKSVNVVVFVKGTRTQPQCGFSHRILTILNEIKVEYEVVNVLDEIHNPGLRDAIKGYSQWPTIPQLYVKGEFVGGTDIADQMFTSGELQQLLRA